MQINLQIDLKREQSNLQQLSGFEQKTGSKAEFQHKKTMSNLFKNLNEDEREQINYSILRETKYTTEDKSHSGKIEELRGEVIG